MPVTTRNARKAGEVSIQTVSVVGAVGVTTGWTVDASILVAILAVLSASTFSLLLFLAYVRSNKLQKSLIELSAAQHEWLVARQEPVLSVASASVTRIVRAQQVKSYPGHAGTAAPQTGIMASVYVTNPGSAVIHVLDMRVRLSKAGYSGEQKYSFRPPTSDARKYRFSEFLPRDFKKLWLFVLDSNAADANATPAVEVAVCYISGSAIRELVIEYESAASLKAGEPESALFSQRTSDLAACRPGLAAVDGAR